jgi:hypothetical protein
MTSILYVLSKYKNYIISVFCSCWYDEMDIVKGLWGATELRRVVYLVSKGLVLSFGRTSKEIILTIDKEKRKEKRLP